jgi:hypothetical protein
LCELNACCEELHDPHRAAASEGCQCASVLLHAGVDGAFFPILLGTVLGLSTRLKVESLLVSIGVVVVYSIAYFLERNIFVEQIFEWTPQRRTWIQRTMEQRIRKVAAYATTMADRYLSARQKLAIFDELTSPEISKLVDRSYGAHAHNALALTLYIDLVRDICAFVLDDADRAASLVNVWRLIQADDLSAALRDRAAQPDNHSLNARGLSSAEREAWLQELRAEDVQRKGASFDEAYARVAEGMPKIIGSELSGIFKTVRDKAIAHYEMRGGNNGPRMFDPSDVNLTWGSVKTFVDQFDNVLWDVVLLATWGSYDEEGFEKTHHLYAADLFARLQGKTTES